MTDEPDVEAEIGRRLLEQRVYRNQAIATGVMVLCTMLLGVGAFALRSPGLDGGVSAALLFGVGVFVYQIRKYRALR